MNEEDVTMMGVVDLETRVTKLVGTDEDWAEAAREASPRDPMMEGRRAYRDGLRPDDEELLQDDLYMHGWFYEWGFLDASALALPLFGGAWDNTAYNAGYTDCTRFQAAALTVAPIADEAFAQFCKVNDWDAEYIAQNLRQLSNIDCVDGAVAYMYATLSPEVKSGELDGEVLGQVIFRVEFKCDSEGVMKLNRCLDLRVPGDNDFIYFFPEIDEAALLSKASPPEIN